MFIQKLGLKIGVGLTLGFLPLTLATKPAAAVNLVTNGSFESPDIPTKSYRFLSSIPGWSLVTGSKGRIEVQDRVAGSPFDGFQFVELDSTAVTGIFQDLATTVGQKYELTFAFSPRPTVAQNILNINWGGNLVDSFSASGVGFSNTNWNTYTYELVATSATTRLSFDNLNEISNSFGTYIDYVSVTSVTTVPEPASIMGVLALGTVGATSLCKRQKQKVSAKA